MLKRIFKYKLSYIIAAFVLIAAVLAIALWPRGSKQSDFPLLAPPQQVSTNIMPLDAQMKYSQLIVDATVKEGLTVEENRPSQEEIDALGDKVGAYSTGRVRMSVNEVIYGEPVNEFNLYLTPAMQDCAPDYKPGDRFVFILQPYQDGYYTITAVNSIFYVAYDEKVYLASLDEPYMRISGNELQNFKDELRELKAQVPTIAE